MMRWAMPSAADMRDDAEGAGTLMILVWYSATTYDLLLLLSNVVGSSGRSVVEEQRKNVEKYLL